MGRKEKKIKKNASNIKELKNKQVDVQQDSLIITEIESKIEECKMKGQFEKALSIIIEAFENGYINRKLVYETAIIYYSLGDYKRTIIWVEKVLTFNHNDVEAQLLLAKVYALQDEMNDCFSAIEKLIESHHQISAEVCSEIEDLLNYFADDYAEEDLLNSYPLIFDFINSAEFVMEDIQEEKIMTEYAEDYSEVSDEQAIDSDETVKDDYSCLKNKSIDEVIAEVMQQSVSLVEKVDLFLQFAVYYYMQKEFAKSLMLLKQALLIDDKNNLVLKNAAFILIEMGEKASALEILSQIKEKDLMVLKQVEVLSKKI